MKTRTTHAARWHPALTLTVLTFLFVACRTPQATPVNLTILYTNDIHGYALPEPAPWVKSQPQPFVGGLAALEQAVTEERSKAAHHLLLDAGDVLTGQPASRFTLRDVKGGYLIAGMNLLGYDAACLGNHEFDGGLSNLNAIVERSEFPWLAANLQDRRERPAQLGRYSIFERGGIRIGVIGLTTPELGQLIDPRMLRRIEVTDPATLQPLIDEVRKKADLIALLTHIGVAGDKRLARKLQGIDLIIGGHTHTRLSPPIVENGVIICQTGCYLRNLGVLELTIAANKITAHNGRLRTLWHTDQTHASPKMTQLLSDLRKKVQALMADTLGEIKTAWTRSRSSECNSGTFIAECMRQAVGAQIGFINSGGIRSDVASGPITRAQLITVLPFSNKMVIFKLSGEQLQAVCRHNAQAQVVKDHGILQISGLSYRFRRQGEAEVELIGVSVGGQRLDPKATYTIATNDYIAFSQPMKYLGLVPTHRELRNQVVSEAVAQQIKAHRLIDAKIQKLMQEVAHN